MCRRRVLQIAWATAALAMAGPGTADSLPFKLFDAHAHFISSDLAQYPLNTPAPIPGVPDNPAVANLRQRIATNATTAERILAEWDAANVEGGAGVQYRTAYGTNNSYLLDTAARFPQRVTPIVLLDALDPNTQYTLRSMVRDRGAAGVRFSGAMDAKSGHYLWLNSPTALQTWQAANELGVVIVLMPLPANTPDAGVLAAIADNARRFPNVKIVLDHFGWMPAEGAPGFGLTPAHLALREVPNIYFKLSSIVLEQQSEAHLSSADFVRHAVDVYGAGRILWGSDIGNTQAPYSEMVKLATESAAKLTPREQRQVFHDTGKAVHVRGGRGAGHGGDGADSDGRRAVTTPR